MGQTCNRYISTVTWLKAVNGPWVLNGNVHIFRICISANQHLADQFAGVLSEAELVRANKYFQQKDRLRFLISRGAQRLILGRFLNRAPEELIFSLGENKKPHVNNTQGANIQYNIAHSGDWIILAVAQTAIGADVEYMDAAFEHQDILAEYFSSDEKAFITQARSIERFYLLWTRKEALLKATAQGLGPHLKVTPSLEGRHFLDRSLQGCKEDWQTSSFKIDSHYLAAVTLPQSVTEILFWEPDFN